MDDLIKRFRELFEYDSSSGILTWRVRPRSDFKRKCDHSKFNNKIAGKPAGSFNSKNGVRCYIHVPVNGKLYKAHRVAWAIYYNYLPKGQIDHIDGDKGNNAISNLRDVNNSTNQRNCPVRSDNKSGLPGVFLDRRDGFFNCYIGSDSKSIYLGKTKSFFDACCIRKSAENGYKYHANHGRV